MTRYGARPRSAAIYDDCYDGTSHTADEIILPIDDDGDDWIDTGLLDSRGEPLWRRIGRNRIGFIIP